MPHKIVTWLATVTAAVLPCAAALAQAPTPTRPDPADAKAATPALQYRSALAGYRRLDAESPPLAWREANDRVERIGGWRAYAREATAPASAPAPAPAASAPR
jgi:hypothetical protein